jgi:hypothetical protein
LSGKQEAPEWQIQARFSKGEEPPSQLAEKLPKTSYLSNRKGIRFRVYGIALLHERE